MGKEKNKQDLFGNQIENNDWQDEWQDMPEFVQEDIWEYQSIIIRFSNENEVEEFAQLIGQKIYPKTQSLWFTAQAKGRDCKKYYVIDES